MSGMQRNVLLPGTLHYSPCRRQLCQQCAEIRCPCHAQVPIQFKLGPLTTISIGVGLLARGGRGTSYRKSNLPKEPIEIWGYEASPFVKLAREASPCPISLCLLPAPYNFIPRH